MDDEALVTAFCVRCDRPARLRIGDGADNADALCPACRDAEVVDRSAGTRQRERGFRLPVYVRARKPLARAHTRV